MLSAVRVAVGDLPPAERAVAAVVLARPAEVLSLSTSALASLAGVSEPTVIRFCRAVGAKGFTELKLRLAGEVARGTHVVEGVVADDDPGDVLRKLVGGAVAALQGVAELARPADLERARDALLGAGTVLLVGFGASASVAADAHHKLLRLPVASLVEVDVHNQLMRAALLEPGDVLVAVSHTGRSLDLLEVATVAAGAGATVVALAAPGSPLAELADVNLGVAVPDDTELYTPSVSRLTALVLLDALVTSVALALGPSLEPRQLRAKEAVRGRRVPSAPSRARRTRR